MGLPMHTTMYTYDNLTNYTKKKTSNGFASNVKVHVLTLAHLFSEVTNYRGIICKPFSRLDIIMDSLQPVFSLLKPNKPEKISI